MFAITRSAIGEELGKVVSIVIQVDKTLKNNLCKRCQLDNRYLFQARTSLKIQTELPIQSDRKLNIFKSFGRAGLNQFQEKEIPKKI